MPLVSSLIRLDENPKDGSPIDMLSCDENNSHFTQSDPALHQSTVLRYTLSPSRSVISFHSSTIVSDYMSCVMRKPVFAYVKTKARISCAIIARLISAFVFNTYIVQSHFLLNPNFHASNQFLKLYSPVCVGPGLKFQKQVF